MISDNLVRTSGASIRTVFAPSSEAEKEISSNSRSKTVCSRRAPMFWLRSFTHWAIRAISPSDSRSEEHTSELQSHLNLVCRLLLEKKKKANSHKATTEKIRYQVYVGTNSVYSCK